ncbi:hypothetical protein [Absidia glauca]|uniref:Ndc10 domain-containing protein n=1 Tax=Absidia glauca TaxID=4829 RepID=A0A163JIF4_ABSGL|nr:hypothetical protein [Absidia glauca]
MVQSLADFPTNSRSFHLALTSLDPSTSLCKKLFPAIDEWHDRLVTKKLGPDNNNSIQPTAAVNAFVQAIMLLRKTFIQGSVLMTKPLPCHSIWQHLIFSDPAYLSLKREANIIALKCSSILTLKC